MHTVIRKLLVAGIAVVASSVANAFEISSISISEAREGEPVSVTARVNWNSQERVIPSLPSDLNASVARTVTAKILPRHSSEGFYWIQPSGSGNTALGIPPTPPAPAPEISLTLFSTLGGYATYRGQYPLLPSTFHNVEVTAKETTYAVRHGQSTPYVIGVEEKKLTKTFVVGLPDGCFNFPSGDVEGWEMSVYRTASGATGTELVSNLTLTADGTDFGTAGGFQSKALKVAADLNLWPALNQFTGAYWSLQFRSPDLERRTAWQNIKGLTFRVQNYMAAMSPDITAIPAIYIRKPKADGTGTEEAWVQQPGAVADTWALWHLPPTQTYSTVLMMPPIPAGATVLKVRLHIYGPLDGILRNVYSSTDTVPFPPPKRIRLDAVCPID